MIAQIQQVNLSQTKSVLERIGDAVFDWRSLLILAAALAAAAIIGNIVAHILRRLTRSVARTADAATDLTTVNRLRRLETWIVLFIAVIRLALLLFALYFWWVYTHPEQGKPSALLGAGAVAVVVFGAVMTPLLRDFSFGAGMMAEQWFGVGDLITIDYPKAQGVVERITLRSTKLRGLNGEIIWLSNQNINGVSVAQKGVWATAIELFVNDVPRAEKLIDRTNKLLPGGLALLASPLQIVSVVQKDKDIWHITAVGETAPGRDWILVTTALDVIKKLDEKSSKPVLHVDPVARFADKDTERLFARAVKNAKKTRRSFDYRKVVTKRISPLASSSNKQKTPR